ncbi:geranylgeranyl diphosphate synthase type I [Naumannella cuiyingiana]|uniref:Geranylgeranyl diphosphate synthase type I n=1 Tax=Naumannella cuiyingiana TaxID=1347891 RepID=A0A7Z0DB09_9ACTN|nr:geranylgeranyl diphosphate synthase type I [Naumannella cuiyingiana]
MDSTPLLDPAEPAGPRLRAGVAAALDTFLAGQAARLAAIGPETAELLRQARAASAGGKRLRPAFCLWGYAAATGELDPPAPVIAAAASLELLHLSALLHDDVMDDSATRRGTPASHKQFEAGHAAAGLAGDQAAFGRAGAILLGDLLLMWSVELLHRAGPAPEQLARGLPLLEQMRTEVTVGQYLDVLAQAAPLDEAGLGTAERVVEYKTARYTVIRPLQFGAALGGASRELQHALADFGSPLGRAFQYRDDLLGVFGDEAVTGKPAGDDLREGKRTALLAHALAGSAPRARAELAGQIGRPDADIDRARQLIMDSGAVARVEEMIDAGRQQALAALTTAGVPDAARRGLTGLVARALDRQA